MFKRARNRAWVWVLSVAIAIGALAVYRLDGNYYYPLGKSDYIAIAEQHLADTSGPDYLKPFPVRRVKYEGSDVSVIFSAEGPVTGALEVVMKRNGAVVRVWTHI